MTLQYDVRLAKPAAAATDDATAAAEAAGAHENFEEVLKYYVSWNM